MMESGPARDFDVSDSIGARFHVAQIAGMTNLVGGCAVGLAVRVEVAAGGSAPVGVVAEFVDVEPARSFGQVAQLSLNAFDHFAAQNANGLQRHLFF